MTITTDRPRLRGRPGRSGRAGRSDRAGEARTAYVLLLPAIIVLVALVLVPILWNVLIGLQRVRLLDLRRFGPLSFLENGLTLDNFALVLGQDGMWLTVLRTVVYALLGTGFSIALGLWAALAMRKPFRGRGVVRALLLLPYVTPVIAATFTWKTMLSPQYGVVNAWGDALFGMPRTDFLGQPSVPIDVFGWHGSFPLSFAVVIAFEAWRYFPFAYIFLQARMQAIPGDLYEAARVDGATVGQQFRHVTLPALTGVLTLLFLLRFIWNFNDFTNIYLLTGGQSGTQVIAIQIYEWLIARNNPGAAAALSLLLACVLVISLVIYFRFFAPKEDR
jgi:multiple sugar transport system permease protein